ncbi:GRIP1-associated protein 1 [Octopus sinensis]|uniref:GRIP1-associated protein 1 n=1 Tax=Octopus sinensis TaxID=2607531 RepID=A0A6P7SB73_9MOLL|nr:GRIP1-associated protein 1 [Octopus sinensis]
MATALSEEEFHRMQIQLLELRTSNYELDSQCKRQQREFLTLKEKFEECDKDLQRANKVINKSKKAKDVELLIQENSGLQRKLQSQEDEFRLQNETLMQELSHLVSCNEELEKRLSSSKDKPSGPDTSSFSSAIINDLEDEVRRVQAQNSALQKTLKASQEKYDKQIAFYKQQLQLGNSTSNNSSHQGKSDDNDEEKRSEDCSNQTSSDSSISQSEALSNDKNKNILQSPSKEECIQELSVLRLNLETELEENRILKEQLNSSDKKFRQQIASFEDEIEKLSEKLKRKQESYVHLQEEKETYFKEAEKRLEEVQAGRDREKKYYTDVVNKLQAEMESKQQMLDEFQNSSCSKIKELENQNLALQQMIDATSIVNNQQRDEVETEYKQRISVLEKQLAMQAQQFDDFKVQLQEGHRASEHTLEQLYAAQQERDTQIQSLQEISTIAEKRKRLIDEMAIKYQKECDSHRELVQHMTQDHAEEVNKLEDLLSQERENCLELNKMRTFVEEIQGQLVSSEETKGWLERRLNDAEANLNSSKQEFESTLLGSQEKYQQEKDELLQKFEQDLEEYKQQETVLKAEIIQRDESINKLQQEIKDSVDEKKIHEKKGLTMLKDLKRQLHTERKRAEKLQERLQEILTDPKNRQGVDDLFKPADIGDKAESSSVSSWSAGASGIGNKDSPQSPNRTGTPPSDFESEHDELVNRLAASQQQKWTLEEKVQHLEESNAAMCEDLLQKSAIIEYYVMDGRTDGLASHHKSTEEKSSLKKVLELVNRGDVNMKEMNRKLQRMLEETLTKNMHLQKDLETLSQEVVRLSKAPSLVSSPTTDLGGDASLPLTEPSSHLNSCPSAILAQ